MIIRIAYRAREQRPQPRLGKVSMGTSTPSFQKLHELEIAIASAVDALHRRQSTQIWSPAIAFSVKSPHQQHGAPTDAHQTRRGHVNSAPTHELQRNVFPSSDIINRIFVYLGKLCDAKTPRLIAYGGFRPRTTQARTRREQILNIGIHIDRRPIRRTSRDGIATSLGTPEEREDSASPSEPHTRNAPCRASSLTPISMSTSKSVRAAPPSARAADRSERSNRFLPHRFGMTSSRAPNDRSPREWKEPSPKACRGPN